MNLLSAAAWDWRVSRLKSVISSMSPVAIACEEVRPFGLDGQRDGSCRCAGRYGHRVLEEPFDDLLVSQLLAVVLDLQQLRQGRLPHTLDAVRLGAHA